MFRSALVGGMTRAQYRAVAGRYVPGDTVVVAGSLAFGARVAHDALGVPLATVHLQPSAMLSLVDPPVTATVRVRSWWPLWFRRLGLWVGERVVMQPLLGPAVNGLRADLGLPPEPRLFGAWRHSPQLVLNLFPDWYGAAPDWPAQARSVGFVRYDQGDATDLSPELERFLGRGPPPVVFTFGSAMRQGHRQFAAAVGACRRAGVRGLLLARGRDQIPAALPDGVFHADYAPFGRIFTRAAAVVHHGGIGTTAQALAAGVPQVVVPMAFDQPDNAARLERLGVARVVWPGRFTPGRAAAALREVLGSAAVAGACRAAAARLAGADPLPAACRLIEGLRGTDRRGA